MVTLTLGDYLTVNVFPVRVTKNVHGYTLGTYGLSHQSYRTQRESAIKSRDVRNYKIRLWPPDTSYDELP